MESKNLETIPEEEVTVDTISDLVKNLKLEEAEKLLSSNENAGFILGTVCENLGMFDFAKKYYLQDSRVNSIHNLGCLLIREDNWKAAHECFDLVIKSDPTFIRSINNAAVSSLIIDPNNYEKAIGYFTQIIEATNNTVVPLDDLTLLQNHKFDCTNEEQCAIAFHNIGFLNMKMNNIEKCKVFLERSYDLLPEYPETLYTLGVLYNGFTMISEPRGSAEKFLKQAHNVYAEKKAEKPIKELNTFPVLRKVDDADIITAYSVDKVVIAKGMVQTEDNIIITHHGKHIPVHRWQTTPSVIRFEYAVNCLQYNSWGFYHWFLETFPRVVYALLMRINVPILVPDKSFVRELLKKLDLDKFVMYINPNDTVCIERSVMLDWECTDRYRSFGNYEFLVPCEVLRKTYETLSTIRVKKDEPQAIVWLSRSKVSIRNCVNEDDLIDALKKSTSLDVVKFIPEEYSLEETLKLMGRCAVFIGVHGGGFSNLLYAHQDTHVIEIGMKENFYKSYFRDMCDTLHFNYTLVAGTTPNMFNAFSLNIQTTSIVKIVLDLVKLSSSVQLDQPVETST